MLNYNNNLRQPARTLRNSQTPAEQILWGKLRRKQINGLQFYRQRPIANFIVDFYCPSAKLIIELDGNHHHQSNQLVADQERTQQLEALGLRVIRFTNQQILAELDTTLTQIHQHTHS